MNLDGVFSIFHSLHKHQQMEIYKEITTLLDRDWNLNNKLYGENENSLTDCNDEIITTDNYIPTLPHYLV